jgi:hypothetical protein
METWGINTKCSSCGHEQKVRLRRGVKLKYVACEHCRKSGTLKRYSQFDKERKKQ